MNNRAPLVEKPYLALPLGTIKPHGWLKEQLQRMASGMTGNLDSIYPAVVGERNGWLGGDGDGWERGPYWIDGLLPLAYILDDENLKSKAQKWIDWVLENQAEDGYMGPVPFKTKPKYEPGLQRGNRTDWWPKMVMLKVLQQYYEATNDKRVIAVMTNYFAYQLKELPNRPLDATTFWAGRRGADNLMVVYWLYTITGDDFLLELGDLVHEQTFPWTDVFLNKLPTEKAIKPHTFFGMKGYPYDSLEIAQSHISQTGSMHTVNLAQGLKQPIVRYQQETDKKFLDAPLTALNDLKTYHGQPSGLYGGDEPLHGNAPTQGIEFCTISESMFSLETNLQITGNTRYADLLERIAYNALPTQADDDFMSRQYFQAANQTELTDKIKTSFESENHKYTDFVFGTVTGYPCCTTNMHQSWPKYVQNLFYATADGGVAALLYASSEVSLKVANDIDLKITEQTQFPFREDVNFMMELSETATFPFHLRIPEWTSKPVVKINGEEVAFSQQQNIIIINREWNNNDTLTLILPMTLRTSKWYKEAITLERGPLVYALKVTDNRMEKYRNDNYGAFTEVYPSSPWNYGLLKSELKDLNTSVKVNLESWDGRYPWNIENAPISLTP